MQRSADDGVGETLDVAGAIRELTDDEIESYVTKGWARVERLFDPSLAARLLEQAQQAMGVDGATKHEDFGRWNHLGNASQLDPLFRAVSFSPAMGRSALRTMRALLPGDYQAVCYWTDNLFVKLPAGSSFGAGTTPFHQDFGGAEDRVGKLNFWIALDEITPERGLLQFYSGSHRLGVLGQPAPGETLLDTYPKLGERCPLESAGVLHAGDATIHHSLVVHGAPENMTNMPRWVYNLMYIQPDSCASGSDYSKTFGEEPAAQGERFKLPIVYSMDA